MSARVRILLAALLASEAPATAQTAPAASAAVGQDARATAAALVEAGYPFAASKGLAVDNFESSFLAGIDKNNPALAELFRQRPDVRAAAIAAGRAEMARQYDAVAVPMAQNALVDIYVAHFSVAELKTILAHHRVFGGKPDPTYNATPLGTRERALAEPMSRAMAGAMGVAGPKIVPFVIAKMKAAVEAATHPSGPKK